MNALLRTPLVAAAAAATLCALASLAQPFAGAVVGALIAAAAVALAVTSGDRARRILWSAVALSALLAGARSLISPAWVGLTIDPRVGSLRDALAAPIRSLVPEPEGGIVLGIVLGERASIPRDVTNAFAVTGTAHLLAISGSNMTLVAGAVAFAVRRRGHPFVVAAATVAAVLTYSVLVGLGASVVRAALMATATSLGLALGRGAAAANGLGAAVVAMLVADPANATDVGFELSVAATAGLLAWQRPLAQRFTRLPRPLAEALAATLAASLPTIPIVAAVFGRVSLISPVANLVAVPLFAPVMLFGAATSFVGLAWPSAAWPLAMAAYASALLLRRSVEIGALVPGAAVNVPTGLATGVVLTVLLAAAAWLGPRAAGLAHVVLSSVARGHSFPRVASRTRVVAGTIAIAIAVVVASAAAAATLSRPAGLRLHALDIGQGDAFLLESDGRYALIDGGPDPTLLLRRLGEVLPPWQRRIDLVALTHEHVDHGAGLLGVIDHYSIGLAVEPVGMSDVPFVRLWSDKLAAAQVTRRAVTAGAVIRLGRTTLRVLAPDEHKVPFPSLVLRVSSAGSSVLFMGDATDEAIADALLDPAALRARLYVPPHHGAATAYADALVSAVRPEAAVISVGLNNKYGHPTPSTLAALGALPVYRTDLYGTVEIELDGPLLVRTAKTPVPPDRGGSLPGTPASR